MKIMKGKYIVKVLQSEKKSQGEIKYYIQLTYIELNLAYS